MSPATSPPNLPPFSHFPYCLNFRKRGYPLGAGIHQAVEFKVAGENETNGGSRFSSRSMGVEVAIEPESNRARYSYLCPKLKLINKKKRREKRKKEEKGRVLTHKGII